MQLTVLPNVEAPAYRQIYEQLAGQILSGTLPAGTVLPPIRTVSKELGVSVITVRGAWDALEADGLIESRAGSGCFVAKLSDSEREKRRETALSEPIRLLAERAKLLGFSTAETQERIGRLWERK